MSSLTNNNTGGGGAGGSEDASPTNNAGGGGVSRSMMMLDPTGMASLAANSQVALPQDDSMDGIEWDDGSVSFAIRGCRGLFCSVSYVRDGCVLRKRDGE